MMTAVVRRVCENVESLTLNVQINSPALTWLATASELVHDGSLVTRRSIINGARTVTTLIWSISVPVEI